MAKAKGKPKGMAGKSREELPRITDIDVKEAMFRLFGEGIQGKHNIWMEIKKTNAIQNVRCFRLYDIYHGEWSNLKNKAMYDTNIHEAEQRLKLGIQTRLERIKDLQEAKDKLVAELKNCKTKDYYIKDGKPMAFDREHRPSEIAALVRSLKLVSAELSKLENDYPATKIDHSIDVSDKVKEQFIELASGVKINLG